MPRTQHLTPRSERRQRRGAAANRTPQETEQRQREQRLRNQRVRRENAAALRNRLHDEHRNRDSDSDPDNPPSPVRNEIITSQDAIAADIARRRIQENLRPTYCSAKILRHDCDVPQPQDIGQMTTICQYCRARLYRGESSTLCCHKGKISLPDIVVPGELRNIFERNDATTTNYLENIRSFNNAFASVQLDTVPIPGRGPFCLKIHGQVYHCVGSLLSPQGQQPTYAGLFLVDFNDALQQRVDRDANSGCSPQLMATLQTLIQENNPYATLFKFVKDTSQEAQIMHLNFTTDNAFDQRRYNQPSASEVAAVFVSDDGAPPGNYTFVMHYKHSGALTTISNLNPHCDPMCYPLLFPCGDSGWTPGMRHVDVHRTAVRTTTTQLQYYAYRLAVRGDFNILHSSGKLFQQYAVDSYVKVEGSRIAYVKSHQKELRAETYAGLMDFLHTEAQQRGVAAGVPVILPSTFIGSPRNMLQNYQDAMAIVGRIGKPDIFVTITCNPKWPEITAELKPYEKAEHRPDLIARVFHLKVKEILHELTKQHIFGIVIGQVHVVEFQKRGLPHVHVLSILRDADKFRDPDQVNALVCAEIPDKVQNPRLYDIITQTMVHGPCGEFNTHAPCMKDNVCTKDYPKDFAPETNVNVNGYPLYRRRNYGRTIVRNNTILDNRWIVPYNPYLSLKYGAHINVEICSSIQSVKYLYKYIYKGHDCASLRLRNSNDRQELQLDETDVFLNCRYVSPPEAMWRLQERPLFDRSHTIVRLPIHLEFEQTIYFPAGGEAQANAQRETKLTAFFKLCSESEVARQYLYYQIPEHYVWKDNVWSPRLRDTQSIGRMFTVPPADRERFFLRILLLHVPGPTGFRNLRTVNGIEYPSYAEAAEKMHLTDTDAEWHHCMEEAANFRMPAQLRDLFATLCLFCSPTNIILLWETFQRPMIEDFLREYEIDVSINMALTHINDTFMQHGRNCHQFGLPMPTDIQPTAEVYDEAEERQKGDENYAQLNPDQRRIADEVLDAITNNTSKMLFVDGPGGSGKTFLYVTLCHILRGQGKTVHPVAWTGIAAKLLPGGTTAHSLFKLPVPVLETSVSSIRLHSLQAQKIREAALIIWDEISMVPKQALQVVNRLLQDIMGNTLPCGGKILLFGGDFRQVLPVVRHGTRTQIVEANVKQASIWQSVLHRTLTVNMRANDDAQFSSWLLQMGSGQLPTHIDVSNDAIQIPRSFFCEYQHFIRNVFDTDVINADNVSQFCKTSILCPKNEDCEINQHIVSNVVHGESRIYFSCDSVQAEGDDQHLYPPEFLHSITPSGLPPHKLELKINTIVMLIRNINVKKGLINGARVVIKEMHDFTLIGVLIDSGRKVVIPRIDLTPSDPTVPFQLKRRQYPIKIAFAITINKSQGQTLDKAGLYLPRPVFSHGQLYVAFSRVKHSTNITINLSTNEKQKITDEYIYTSNVVFTEVL